MPPTDPTAALRTALGNDDEWEHGPEYTAELLTIIERHRAALATPQADDPSGPRDTYERGYAEGYDAGRMFEQHRAKGVRGGDDDADQWDPTVPSLT